ncbi:MAG: metal ABC transporter permease [Pseudobdellovibrionaceae bacterium]
MIDFLVSPFIEFAFLRNALLACIFISLAAGPLGTFLLLRRMSLVGDAMSHAVLPGVAVGFFIFGLSLSAMTIGGFIAGLSVALLSGLVTRFTPLKEDASFATFYLMSLALGVMLISMRGSQVDLIHILFGSILAVDNASLSLIIGTSLVVTSGLLLIFRLLVIECFDSEFLKSIGKSGTWVHFVFLALIVMILVVSFQALGTLMSVGLLMLPAASSRFWTHDLKWMLVVSSGLGMLAGYFGLLVSYHFDFSSGPAIVLMAGFFYCLSLVFGRHSSVVDHWIKRRHFQH